MVTIKTNTSYFNTGDHFSRVILIGGNFENRKKILFFDTIEELHRFEKVWDYFNPKNKSIVIDDFSALHSYHFENAGTYLAIKDLFFLEIPDKYELQKSTIDVRIGMVIEIDDLIKKLIDFGYSHSAHLSKNGSYNIEGDIVNVRFPHGRNTYKISFFDNEIDEILKLDKDDSKNVEKLKELNIYSNDKSDIGGKKSIKDNLDRISFIFRDGIKIFIGIDFMEEKTSILSRLDNYVDLSNVFKNLGETDLRISDIDINNVDELKEILAMKKTKIYTKNVKTITNFVDYNNISDSSVEIIEITDKRLNLESFSDSESEMICDDILSNIFIKKRYRKSLSKDLDLLLQIKPGDYIVHIDHGVGIFKQIVLKDLSGIKREYIEIEYRENDKLFVPIGELYRISKYIGSEDPKLTRLSSNEWNKIIKNTEIEVEKIAKELLEVYAKRSIAKGYSFIRFEKKEEEFRKGFPYIHTMDQEKSIVEILGDMEKSTPMDRLLTGDVGFGKTEVACNAIYKAFLNKKQVALISPLVILAFEHFESLKKRFKDFGVRIEIITRVSTSREQTLILKKLRNGEIDCIIGTHRLLSEDVEFKNLGLLIVDEEHKFGVIDKEKINKIRSNIDILSLSATPIPRSLNFALNGIKEISIIATPPQGKKPIRTIVSKFSDEIIINAVKDELSRKGQVIFIHNRVATIESMKKYLEEILRGISITITHGQMSGIEVEDRIMDFKNGKYDILLSTTVIENGVNFLNANTIIINDAETFGLSQLHQLRGRVGRGKTEGHCYLVYRKENLPDDAKKRLVTIVNNTHLGAGFEIALRDLEIRGAGDILGIKQSGKSNDTGISLYLKLLEEKIEELKTGEYRNRVDCKIELSISYYISDEFFETEIDKISFFRNIESIETIEDLEYSHETFAYSKDSIPEEFENLFMLLKARIILSQYGVVSLKKVLNNYVFEFDKNTGIEKIREFLNLDKDGNFVIQTIHKIKVDVANFAGDKEFLESLI
ncbi:MAG: CarD family transcriptional regulator [Candidatus Gracilibacteria bacterium]|nr:CarD family transcriptional regulator [Candidatus Gracilibacteria bacterium]